MNDVLADLEWRGLIADSTDQEELARRLAAGPVTFYCGFDPTAPSLHLGNLVQILTMRRLQDGGHLPLALVGGATGLIGDPKESGSGSSTTGTRSRAGSTASSSNCVASWPSRATRPRAW